MLVDYLKLRRQILHVKQSDHSATCTLCSFHYANMSVQYTAIFNGCKNDNFQMKFFDIFLIFAQNIDRGYMLEPPQ